MNAVKQFFAAHRHVWTLAYFPFYLAAFFALERMPGRTPHIIHSSLDAAIPFCEYFVVPYFLWFIFIAVTLVWFFFRDVPGFYRLMAYLCAGMTVFLLVSALWPNGLHLRPAYIGRDNVFVDMVRFLYRIDTSTNVMPSLHVYNTLCCWVAIGRSAKLRPNRLLQAVVAVLSVSIILSTMFLKQHSFVDVSTAFMLAFALYFPCCEARTPRRLRLRRLTGK